MATVIADIGNALRWEWFRLSRRLAFRVIMGMIAGAVIVILASTMLLSDLTSETYTAVVYPYLIFLALTVVGPFLGVFLTAIAFSGEFGWGTLRTMLARGQPRWRVALVKLLLVSMILALVWVVSWSLAAVAGLIAGVPGPLNDFPFSDAPAGWWDSVGIFFSSLPAAIAYMSLTALLCLAGRSATFGVIVAAAILIAESTAYPVAVLIAEEVYGFPLYEYVRWTLRGATAGLAGRYDDINPWHFVPAVAAYITLFWTLAVWVTERRDVSSGNG